MYGWPLCGTREPLLLVITVPVMAVHGEEFSEAQMVINSVLFVDKNTTLICK